jgi:hypothetical protein
MSITDDTNAQPPTEIKGKRWKLIVDTRWLFLVAGLLWSGVGVMLDRRAIRWLTPVAIPQVWVYVLSGLLLALMIYKFGFLRLAKKNIWRINQMQKKVSLFAFQKRSSYFIVVVMILMGKSVRRLPIPRPYLAVLYFGIGGGLLLASLHYYWELAAAKSLNKEAEAE